jgi:hypothetical protein
MSNNTATFAISKVITVVTDSNAYRIKSSDFASEAAKFDAVLLKGWFSVSKFNKYESAIIAEGFVKSDVIAFDLSEKGDSVDFYILYKKS